MCPKIERWVKIQNPQILLHILQPSLQDKVKRELTDHMVPIFLFYRRKSWGLVRTGLAKTTQRGKAQQVWEVRILDPKAPSLGQFSFPYIIPPYILVLFAEESMVAQLRKKRPLVLRYNPCGMWLFKCSGGPQKSEQRLGMLSQDGATCSQVLFPKTTSSQ